MIRAAGDYAALLPGAARFFGAEAYAALFDRAIAHFDPARIGDRSYRQDRLEEIGDEPFESLTDELFALEDAGDVLWARMIEYVDARPGLFFRDRQGDTSRTTGDSTATDL